MKKVQLGGEWPIRGSFSKIEKQIRFEKESDFSLK